MVGVDDGVGTEVDVNEAMNKEFTLEPERVPQTAPVVYLGEASRAAPYNVTASQIKLSSHLPDLRIHESTA